LQSNNDLGWQANRIAFLSGVPNSSIGLLHSPSRLHYLKNIRIGVPKYSSASAYKAFFNLHYLKNIRIGGAERPPRIKFSYPPGRPLDTCPINRRKKHESETAHSAQSHMTPRAARATTATEGPGRGRRRRPKADPGGTSGGQAPPMLRPPSTIFSRD
jgi:hypothetical protein